MTAIATRRKPSEAAQLREDLDAVRAENTELRQALRAVAALAIGIGVNRAPVGVGGGVRSITDVARLYGVSPSHADLITRLFES